MLRSFLQLGGRHLRHRACADGDLLRALNGSQGFSSSRSGKGRGKGGEGSIRQHRLASEVKSIVSAALQQGPCNVTLLQRCGFEIEQVKMSGDLRKAFVLWKAMPGMHQTVERELNAQGKRLRSMVFEHLSMPFSPAIEFRQDKLNPQAQAIDDILAKLDEESDSGLS
ncbi:hypothetical protein KC19_7G166000 [Ceratodon purpureus]|uniref:Ribosome-binding factor A n=1 Tax=Ceratodon purpureus TaxID=3225 RepID=A0A8T0HAH6_CERPU|nr:hypothetical protein KC19_7G166000 [Ceratodon purpureus]